MQVSATAVQGVKLLDTQSNYDARGSFRRIWCERELGEAGIMRDPVQVSVSETKRRGTLRGMHFQLAPSREDKLVHCLKGIIHDVVLDLRPRSPTYRSHMGLELSDNNCAALFVPAGCAHGFLTLTDNCTVLYFMSDFYDPELATGVRWNDPTFGIVWPEQPREILDRDAHYPDFDAKKVEGFLDYR